ncbi:spore cortex biosynthesis protein YabQ [Acetonema longum]|uniref:Spore cortex biosynthesis protein YabQ n=1 Tax=Acetonema longum DSM 6540 TaxID=1009370 RepID=F7NH65_9FIRM|nr:spore cortex biosynthesis protein YabQ [Acetonema longum]EGO64548.1 spore cortex biosynthesis protein YabQ [Acetonema longum DSM 6540]
MNEQLHTFMVTVAIGAGLGILYDFYRVGKRAHRLRNLLTAAGDLLYWLVATAAVFFTLLYCNWGELRLYVFLGLASGAFLYFRFLSLYLVRGLIFIGRICRRILQYVTAIIYYFAIRPVFWIFNFVGYPFRLVHRGARRWRRSRRPPPSKS